MYAKLIWAGRPYQNSAAVGAMQHIANAGEGQLQPYQQGPNLYLGHSSYVAEPLSGLQRCPSLRLRSAPVTFHKCQVKVTCDMSQFGRQPRSISFAILPPPPPPGSCLLILMLSSQAPVEAAVSMSDMPRGIIRHREKWTHGEKAQQGAICSSASPLNELACYAMVGAGRWGER